MFLINLPRALRKWHAKSIHCMKINDAAIPVHLKISSEGFKEWREDGLIPITNGECRLNVQLLSVKKLGYENSYNLPSCSADDTGLTDSPAFENVLQIDSNCLSVRNLLVFAIVNDRLEQFKSCVKSDIDFLSAFVEGYSLLHFTALKGSCKCLEYILQRLAQKEKETWRRGRDGVNSSLRDHLFAVDVNGDTIVHLACRIPSSSCFKIICGLIMRNLGWDALKEILLLCNSSGQNPLHVACLWRNYKTVYLLVTNQFEKAVLKNFSNMSWKRTSLRREVKKFRAILTATLLNYLNNGTVLHGLAHARCLTSKHVVNCKARVKLSNLSCFPNSFVFSEDDIDVPEERCVHCEGELKKLLDLVCRVAPGLTSLRRKGNVSPLMDAAASDSVAMVTTLLRLGVDVEEADLEGRTALHYAANYGMSRQVALLLSNGARPLHQDCQGVTPIHLAAMYGFTACLRLLYTASNLMDIPAARGYTALLWSAYYGMEASLEMLLCLKDDIDKGQTDGEGCTALHLAATRDHNKCVELLIREKWAIEARNVKGETPLLLAAKSGHLETVRILAEHGANVNARDLEGNTCIHLGVGARLSSKEFRELLALIPSFELINAKNLNGKTPLHMAVEVNSFESALELIKLGAISRVKDKDGWDPFMYSIRYGCNSIIALLLRYFPNVNCYSNKTGYSTLSVALECGDLLLVSQLKALGAKTPKEILWDAAVKIQRWYRRQVLIRKLCCRTKRTSEKVRQACIRLSADMFDAGFIV